MMYNLGTLIKYEYKKLLHRRSVWVVTLSLTALTLVSVVLPPFMTSVSIEDSLNYTDYEETVTQRKLAADLAGRAIDEDLLREMNAVYSLERFAVLSENQQKTLTPESEQSSQTGTGQPLLSDELLSALPDDLRSRLPEDLSSVRLEDLTAFPGSDVPYSVKYSDIDYFYDDSGAASADGFEQTDDGGFPQYSISTEELYNLRRSTNEMIWDARHLTDGEKEYLSDREDALSTPFLYEFSAGYKSILSNTVLLAIIISFFTAICIPPVSADEHLRRTDQLILCTRFGRRQAFLAKLFTAATFSMAVALLLFAALAIPAFLMYGTEGFSAQIQIALPGCSWDLTMGEAVLILLAVLLTSALLLSSAALTLAERFQNSLQASGILIGVLLVSAFLNIPEQYRIPSQILSFFPAKLLSVSGSLLESRLVPFFGTYLASWQTGLILYLILSLLFALAGYFVYRRWQAGGR